ncbi:hypothetical protein SAMN02745166_04215 [Prosthecobacter debontii]|uniref:Uncharacterized protein n=1 Tax=Prosthecobacter debontii TaxID=48467 RepID=A0A1T4YUB4_9BACT|nr:hypothetical protein SAMN02745166_04215 [Prosthecobacter debontii]
MRFCLIFLYLMASGEMLQGQSGSGYFHSSVRWSQPNVELPPHIQGTPGKITLIADYEKADASGVPLYLINLTNKDTSFWSQDGDLSVKLERQVNAEQWLRCQAHVYSWCGNSYGSRLLSSGHHFVFKGFRPQSGKKAPVRYALRTPSEVILSNIGDGFYEPEEEANALIDSMALKEIPTALADLLQLGRFGDHKEVTWENRICGLRLLQKMGGLPSGKTLTDKWSAELSSKASLTENESAALAALQSFKSVSWSLDATPGQLLQYITSLLSADSSNLETYGSPSADRAVLWGIASGLAHSSAYMPLDDWKPLLSLALDCLDRGPNRTRSQVLNLLNQGRLTDQCMASSAFEPLLKSADQDVVKLAAKTLSRRAKGARLIELSGQLPQQSRMVILSALIDAKKTMRSTGGELGYFFDPVELQYLRECVRQSPIQAAPLVSDAGGQAIRLEDFLREQLSLYWDREMKDPEKTNHDFELDASDHAYERALAILAELPLDSSRLPSLSRNQTQSEVIPLLKRLLNHRGYTVTRTHLPVGDGTFKPFKRYHYIVRESAHKALTQLHEAVPVGLEFEKLIPDPQATENSLKAAPLPSIKQRRPLIPAIESPKN